MGETVQKLEERASRQLGSLTRLQNFVKKVQQAKTDCTAPS
jgi:hypothetical protein